MNSLPQTPDDLPEVSIISYKDDPLLAHLSASTGHLVRNHNRWEYGYMWCDLTPDYAERCIRRYCRAHFECVAPVHICAMLAKHFGSAELYVHSRSVVIEITWYAGHHIHLGPSYKTISVILKDGD